MRGRLVSSVVKHSKQKVVTAKVLDVLGNLCSVQLSGRGAVLHGLKFNGPAPAKGDTVYVDYRNSIPVVQTSSSNLETKITELETRITAQTVGTTSKPPSAPPETTTTQGDLDNLDDIGDVDVASATDGQVLTLDAGIWVAEDPAGGIPDAPSDGELYGRKDAAWEIVPEGGGGGVTLQLVMEPGVTHPPVPVETPDGDDWVYYEV